MAMCHDGQAMGYFYPTLYKNNNFYVFFTFKAFVTFFVFG